SDVQLSGSAQLDTLPLPGSTVTFTSTGGGTLSSATATVDANGGFSTTFQLPPSGTGSANVTASVSVEGQEVTRDAAISWAGDVRGDRLIWTATADSPSIFHVYKVEPLATTEVFAASAPAGAFGQPVYLRLQQKMVVGFSGAPDSSGWGLLDATGAFEVVKAALTDLTDVPLTVSANGKFQLHQAGVHSCTGGSEGTCSTTYSARIYDGATNALVDEFNPVAGAEYSFMAIGPAGEVLYPETNTGSLQIRRIGGATTSVVGFPASSALAFSTAGDKIYVVHQPDAYEYDLATNASRTLPASIVGNSTVELGGLLWVNPSDAEPRQLHRLDLASGQVADVGAVPASNYWLALVP
ncbi:MAG: hypothetical protein ACXWLM_09645, partial [Myxococcales bacterium]